MAGSDDASLASNRTFGLRTPALAATALDGGSIEIRFPAEWAVLDLLRTVIGRVSHMAGFSYDGIEDFSMAVGEAATLLIESKPAELAVTVSGMSSGGRPLLVVVKAREPTKALSLSELRQGYRWDLLAALCEHIWWEEAGLAIGLAQTAR